MLCISLRIALKVTYFAEFLANEINLLRFVLSMTYKLLLLVTSPFEQMNDFIKQIQLQSIEWKCAVISTLSVPSLPTTLAAQVNTFRV